MSIHLLMIKHLMTTPHNKLYRTVLYFRRRL